MVTRTARFVVVDLLIFILGEVVQIVSLAIVLFSPISCEVLGSYAILNTQTDSELL